jgi:HAD superfamily hydrolase (TIGR01509 family)
MKSYLFDFDGTLVDSMPAFIKTMLRILDENGIEYGDDIVKIITPLGYAGTARYYIELGVPMTEGEIMLKMTEYALDEYVYRIEAKESVISTLNALKARGYSLNVLTASPHSMLDPCLKRLGIFDLFDNVWSCDDFGTTKADPNIYKMAAERMGTTVDEVIFIDDNYNADKTAKSAGMIVGGIYDKSSEDYVDSIKEITDFYIYDFSELLEL